MRTATNHRSQGRTEKVAAAHAEMLEALGELTTSEDWRRVLDTASQMHSYSPRNRLWLAIQAAERNMELSVVFGYRAWQAHGRQVKKGERGLLVLCPIVSRGRPEDDDDSEQVRTILHTFRLGHVFDLGQTEGDDWPELAPQRLEGIAPAGLWHALVAQVEDQGFDVVIGTTEHPGANGETDWLRSRVTVRAELEPAQKAKTLAHELAHVVLHRPDESQRPPSRALCEVEAESVAYLVCKALELDSDAYSLPYVASWAAGDPEVAAAVAERAIGAAEAIIEAVGERAGVPA